MLGVLTKIRRRIGDPSVITCTAMFLCLALPLHASAGKWQDTNDVTVRLTESGKDYQVIISEDGIKFISLDDDAEVETIVIDEDGIKIDGKEITGDIDEFNIDFDELEQLIESDELRGLETIVDIDFDKILAKAKISIRQREELMSQKERLEEEKAALEDAMEREAAAMEEAGDRQSEFRGRTPRPPRPPRIPGERRSKKSSIFRVGSNVTIDEDERIKGDVVVVGGSVRIEGTVTGDVIAIGGNIRIKDSGEIYGDAVTIGGSIDEDPDAYVGGQTFDLSSGILDNIHINISPWRFHHWKSSTFMGSAFSLLGKILKIGILFLLGALILMLFRNNLGVTQNTVMISPWFAGLVGFVTEVLLFPILLIVFIILCITVIGIPLAFLLVPLAVLTVIAGFVFGYIAVAMGVDSFIETRTAIKTESIYLKLLLGLTAIMVFTLLAKIIGLGGFFVSPISTIFAVIGVIIEYLAWTVGLGAVVLTLFGKKPYPIAASPGLGGTPPTSSSETGEMIGVNDDEEVVEEKHELEQEKSEATTNDRKHTGKRAKPKRARRKKEPSGDES